MGDLAIEGRGLVCDRGGRRVFAGVDFDVSAGEALVVTGPNGAGKSSLLRTIAGLIELADGTLELTGGDPELPLGAHCHYFGHENALKTQLTVRENLEFWHRYYGDCGVSVLEALDRVGIGHLDHLPAAVLSAGQRRRLALARLVVSHRPVWLLDEPTAALDVASEVRLGELMSAHLLADGLIIAVTHGSLPLAETKSLKLGEARVA
ncbi:heme exporter protein A [Rhodobium orientis]|uniref:Heme ABC exporter ATP-binding protein CcmA n=1 Tax=Rhodobium orientis TaxID=34017 RepID=A0A327JM69_9HYPH|nr:heme ABC exporter ATP-binding protein CcmA [Rhodobium orientis]MBB4305192.1 heme exporter protein A [Rhodobium orientis]MBK5948705.1 heme ABC exporter ATP-binding protein CcmA [Rhodobium orientis]RAI26676.1 heme ABC exporter ATP-binding protein CcmA [Rhodobium orientis]